MGPLVLEFCWPRPASRGSPKAEFGYAAEMVRGRDPFFSTRPRSWRRGALWLSCCLPIAVAAACDAGPERRTLRNQGLACVEAPASVFGDCSEHQITADVPLQVEVDFGTCTSSSCDRVLNAACRASRSGSVITIEAETVIEREGGECTDDCGFVTASCEIAPLPAGTYELRYGNDSVSLTVPTTTIGGCVGTNIHGRCCDTSDDCGGNLCENQRCRL